MKPSMSRELKRIRLASKEGWETLRVSEGEIRNDLVTVKWEVDYDELGHDIAIQAKVSLKNPKDNLLQIWLCDLHPGIWIPELRPWVSSVVEFAPEQKVKFAKVGLVDSKWRPEDRGQTYLARLWGYFETAAGIKKFSLEKEFIYPK